MSATANQVFNQTQEPDILKGYGRSRLETVRRRFGNINRLRFDRITERLGAHQRVFLSVLPLLLHTNHSMIPGFVGSNCPCGVSDYSPSKATVRDIQRLSRSFVLKKGVASKVEIHAIYLMGSSGTVAQSSSSDLDIWLCHAPEVGDASLELLRKKAVAIEQWALTLGLEVHFFVMNADLFRHSGAEELSSESSGTAQRYLLLDEFYRTSVLVQGRAPIWWVVPPELEVNYDQVVEQLYKQRYVSRHDYLDFGNVASIPPAEFYGATLWQLTKAIDAPQKSLLKILLLESYAASFPALDLLSTRFKSAVYSDKTSASDFDPYILLYKKVEEHLSSVGALSRLDLARQCFYLKADVRAQTVATRPDWLSTAVGELLDEWRWTKHQMQRLDNRSNWKIDKMVEERQSMVSALKHSYKMLSVFARKNSAEIAVSEQDMTILGRKLFTAFEQKAGKVDIVGRNQSPGLAESHLYFQPLMVDGLRQWLLFREPADLEKPKRLVTKRTTTLVELIVWCHFNGLLTDTTRVIVEDSQSKVSADEIERLGVHLRHDFPRCLLGDIDVEALSKPACALKIGCFANLDVGDKNSRSDDSFLTSNRTDALSYSGWHENLIYRLDYLVITSWGEVLTYPFHDGEGLLEALCTHLKWVALATPIHPINIVYGCESRYRQTIVSRLRGLFHNVSQWFLKTRANRARYILRVANSYHVLACTNGTASHDFQGTYPQLLDYLSAPTDFFTKVNCDPWAFDDAVLPHIYANNQANVIQFFFYTQDTRARVFIVDELGALFFDEVDYFNEQALINHYSLFFDAVDFRHQAALEESADELSNNAMRAQGVDFHRLKINASGVCEDEPVVNTETRHSHAFVDVKVIGEFETGASSFSVFINETEFSTRELGSRLFQEVTEHIFSQRQSHTRYPIYITDLDLSWLRESLPEGGLKTSHYLNYKKRIERKLNHVLALPRTN